MSQDEWVYTTVRFRYALFSGGLDWRGGIYFDIQDVIEKGEKKEADKKTISPQSFVSPICTNTRTKGNGDASAVRYLDISCVYYPVSPEI